MSGAAIGVDELTNRYGVVETNDRVPGMEPVLRTRFYGRARRRQAKLNSQRAILTYRWGIVRNDGRYEVCAFQNLPRRTHGDEFRNVPPETTHA